MKVIMFLVGQSPYQTGEIAGFPDDVADRYIAKGVAEPYKPPPSKPTVVAEEAPPKDKMIRRSKQK